MRREPKVASRWRLAVFQSRVVRFVCAGMISASCGPGISVADGLPPPATALGANTCAGATTIEFAQCLSRQLNALQKKLAGVYEGVLQRTPEHSAFDDRKTRAQLEKAQAAWENYTRANCAYVGAIEGGSNAWVTVFEVQCLIQETKARIQFFEHPPTMG